MISVSEFTNIYIHTYIFNKLLSPMGHLSTSRTLPHTHTLLHLRLSILKDYLLPITLRNTIREKSNSVNNEHDNVLMLVGRVNSIYGDSAAHTADPRSNI